MLASRRGAAARVLASSGPHRPAHKPWPVVARTEPKTLLYEKSVNDPLVYQPTKDGGVQAMSGDAEAAADAWQSRFGIDSRLGLGPRHEGVFTSKGRPRLGGA